MTMNAMRAEFIKTILMNAKAHIEAALSGEVEIAETDGNHLTITSEDGGTLVVDISTGEVTLTPDEE